MDRLSRVGVIRLALRDKGVIYRANNLEISGLLCYYTASAAFCKYPKVPIFEKNFRHKCAM